MSAVRENRVAWSTVAGAVAGNALEWYDFTVFASLGPIVSRVFFRNPQNGILFVSALFGIGFLTRPLGGLLIGRYAERHGPGRGLMLGMGLMALSMLLIACAPDYAHAGLFGAGLLAIARLCQGFSAGAEFATSTIVLVTAAPHARRGFYGSWQMVGQIAALLLGGAVGYAVTRTLTPAQIDAFGWRIPFAVGLSIVPAVMIMRRGMMRAPHDARPTERAAFTDIAHSVGRQWVRAVAAFGLIGTSSASVYILYGYVVTYATMMLHLPIAAVYFAQIPAAFILMLIVPVGGLLADVWGGRRLLATVLAVYLLSIWPAYAWLSAAPSLIRLEVVQFGMSIVIGLFLGSYCTVLVDLFAPRLRTTTLSAVHNISVMIVGGTAQLVVTLLWRWTASPMAPAMFVLGAVSLGFLGAITIAREPTARRAAFGPMPTTDLLG
jgi:MFS transporter, MHS family, proline/betaine transporter